MVERFNPGWNPVSVQGMHQWEYGNYVRHSDYEALAKELADAKEALLPFSRVSQNIDAGWSRGVWVAPLNGKEEGEKFDPATTRDTDLVVVFGGEFLGGVSIDGITLGDLRAARRLVEGDGKS